jgi:hypothetical protein
MEGGYKLWDEILKTIQALTSWPLVVLYLSLLFRQALTRQIPALFKSFEALIERLAKVKYKGVKAEFELDKLRDLAAEAAPELTEEVVLNIGASPEEDHDKPTHD